MKVTLREKKLKDGKISYYLDYYDNYSKKRKYEFIGIHSYKGSRREKKELAEAIRKARESEYQHTSFNLIPDFKKRTSLIKYFEKKLEKKNRWSSHHSTLKHLREFAKNDISFQEVDKDLLEKFKEYLLSKVSQNTAYNYFTILKGIFKQAKKEKIIVLNVAEDIAHIKQIDSKMEFLSIQEVQKLASKVCKHPRSEKSFFI